MDDFGNVPFYQMLLHVSVALPLLFLAIYGPLRASRDSGGIAAPAAATTYRGTNGTPAIARFWPRADLRNGSIRAFRR